MQHLIDGVVTDGRESKSYFRKEQAQQLADLLTVLSSAMSSDSLVELTCSNSQLSAQIVADNLSADSAKTETLALREAEQETKLRELWSVLREGLTKRGDRLHGCITRR